MHASMPAVGNRAACQARRIADIKAILGRDDQVGGPGTSETSGLAHGVKLPGRRPSGCRFPPAHQHRAGRAPRGSAPRPGWREPRRRAPTPSNASMP